MDEWSANHKDLYLHRTSQYINTKTNIHASSGIPTHDPSNETAKSHALDRAATGTGFIYSRTLKRIGVPESALPPPPNLLIVLTGQISSPDRRPKLTQSSVYNIPHFNTEDTCSLLLRNVSMKSEAHTAQQTRRPQCTPLQDVKRRLSARIQRNVARM
jgi:hypothetical protein